MLIYIGIVWIGAVYGYMTAIKNSAGTDLFRFVMIIWIISSISDPNTSLSEDLSQVAILTVAYGMSVFVSLFITERYLSKKRSF